MLCFILFRFSTWFYYKLCLIFWPCHRISSNLSDKYTFFCFITWVFYCESLDRKLRALPPCSLTPVDASLPPFISFAHSRIPAASRALPSCFSPPGKMAAPAVLRSSGPPLCPSFAEVCSFLERYGAALDLPEMTFPQMERYLRDTTTGESPVDGSVGVGGGGGGAKKCWKAATLEAKEGGQHHHNNHHHHRRHGRDEDDENWSVCACVCVYGPAGQHHTESLGSSDRLWRFFGSRLEPLFSSKKSSPTPQFPRKRSGSWKTLAC